MQITRNSIETATRPADRFTGHVYVDAITAATPPSRLQAATVHFAPGARTAWHTHPNRQTIYVLQGIGRCQHRGGPIEIIGPGDRVFFEPEEDHRHGAAPDRFMIHLAMLEVDDNANSAIPRISRQRTGIRSRTSQHVTSHRRSSQHTWPKQQLGDDHRHNLRRCSPRHHSRPC